jgi:hypothetical protein
MMAITFLLALLLLVPQPGRAAETTCKRSAALTGPCRMVKGSLGFTRGLGVTLTEDDGTRTLIKAPPDGNADIATPVMQNWLYWQSKTGRMDARIRGTYELCPLPTQVNGAGIAGFGCINRGSRITLDRSQD